MGIKDVHIAIDNVNGIFTNTAALPVSCPYNTVGFSTPDSKSFCGTKIESIKFIIVPTVAPTEIGMAIFNILFNKSVLVLTFFIPASFFTLLYFKTKYIPATNAPPAAPKAAPPAEYSIPLSKRK